LAVATSIGAWINLLLVVWFASRTGFPTADARLRQSLWKFALAGVVLAGALYLAQFPASSFAAGWAGLRDEVTLGVLAAAGTIGYAILILALFGPRWLKTMRTVAQTVNSSPLGNKIDDK
jgi:putative peptidoglycan lipid II flippase